MVLALLQRSSKGVVYWWMGDINNVAVQINLNSGHNLIDLYWKILASNYLLFY